MAGLFITLEGPEGSGKTTIASLVEKKLKEKGLNVVMTREPGGIEISEQIRKIILDPNNTAMDSKTEALLYAAARRQHLVEKVIPALKQEAIVICDRFIDSSLVYQGIGRGLGIDKVYDMNLFAIEDIMPDFTLFFDIDPKLGLERIHKDQQREINRLDMEDLNFHLKVYRGYKEVVSRYPERIIEIDASKSIEEVFNSVMNILKEYIC